MPALDELLKQHRERGYVVHVFWMMRLRHPTIKSQVRLQHAATEEEAWRAIEKANHLIGSFVHHHELPCQIVRYERIVRDLEHIHAKLARWGLKVDSLPEIFDGNAKYADDAPLVAPAIQRFPVPG